MVPISREQCGDLLAMWLEKASSVENLKQVVKDTGYNDSPFFGAEKKKVRIMGELVMANTALAILAVNQVFEDDDAQAIIDTFLAVARKSVFTYLETKDSTFKKRYEERLGDYFKTFGEQRALLGMTFIFMESLDLNPLKNGEGQMRLADRFGQSLNETIDVLRRLELRGADPGDVGTPAPGSTDSQRPASPPPLPRRDSGFVGMMDIDNFDFINDKLGRNAGDQVMQAYKKLTASKTKTDVILNEAGFHAFQAQARGEVVPAGDVLREKLGGQEFVLCFPYSSGDEFVIHHRNHENLRSMLEQIRRAGAELKISIFDSSGVPTALLHGIPISIGSGPSWKEAWNAVIAQKRARTTPGMEDRLELLSQEAGAPSSSSPEAAVAKIMRDKPKTDPTTGLPSTLDIVTETTPKGLVPVVMWGPVETRRPGWTKAHQEKMYGEILGHMRSLGITDIERFKKTAQEVSELTDQVWRSVGAAVAKARSQPK